MATKTTTKVKETEEFIIFKANKPLTEEEFGLLSDLIKSEKKKTGLKIVLMPYSCDIGGDTNE